MKNFEEDEIFYEASDNIFKDENKSPLKQNKNKNNFSFNPNLTNFDDENIDNNPIEFERSYNRRETVYEDASDMPDELYNNNNENYEDRNSHISQISSNNANFTTESLVKDVLILRNTLNIVRTSPLNIFN